MDSNWILLHGALGSSQQMQRLDKSFPAGTVYNPDLPGHGSRAAEEGPITMQKMADELDAHIRESGKGKVSIFGYSMGGYVALLAALKNSAISRIITLGTKFDWSPETAAKEVRMLHPKKIEAKVPAFAKMLADRHGENYWKSVLHKTADMMTGLGNAPDLTAEKLTQIRAEVSICLGDQDNMVSREESEWATKQIPGADFKILEATPHPFEKVDVQKILSIIK
ncbi:MAG: alpha/beta hydrolase [Bacteroidetes bacterium]|nr:alpha/beta hydrolase [Bacteroidota bacterium]